MPTVINGCARTHRSRYGQRMNADDSLLEVDVAIVGAGMAGASLAAAIGDAARVALIEMEGQPGYHATGRSAAFWSETYGGPAIQPLTSASGAFLREGGFLRPRGELTIARAGEAHLLDAMLSDFAGSGVQLDRVDPRPIVPGLRPDWQAALSEPSCCDIDVGALHAHYLKAARPQARLMCDAEAFDVQRDNGRWRIETRSRPVSARLLVNAAGAWASRVAQLAGASPIAITPYRRTVVQLVVDPPASSDLPLVIDAAGTFYFKPEAGGRIWLCPHDETPSAPVDAAPEEIDVALAIDRLEKAVDWRIVRRERAWAGLRSFAPDRAPVYGHDPACPGFFWFAGQGGFGIQTAPAAALLGAALLLGQPLPEPVSGLDVTRYAPGRF